MKTRTGFVSNSSSSSFICDVCGCAEESYDGDGVVRCENEHEICNDCDSSKFVKIDSSNWGSVVSKETCPVCTKKVIPDYERLRYFYNTLGITPEQTAELIRGNISFDDFFRGIVPDEDKK